MCDDVFGYSFILTIASDDGHWQVVVVLFSSCLSARVALKAFLLWQYMQSTRIVNRMRQITACRNVLYRSARKEARQRSMRSAWPGRDQNYYDCVGELAVLSLFRVNKASDANVYT